MGACICKPVAQGDSGAGETVPVKPLPDRVEVPTLDSHQGHGIDVAEEHAKLLECLDHLKSQKSQWDDFFASLDREKILKASAGILSGEIKQGEFVDIANVQKRRRKKSEKKKGSKKTRKAKPGRFAVSADTNSSKDRRPSSRPIQSTAHSIKSSEIQAKWFGDGVIALVDAPTPASQSITEWLEKRVPEPEIIIAYRESLSLAENAKNEGSSSERLRELKKDYRHYREDDSDCDEKQSRVNDEKLDMPFIEEWRNTQLYGTSVETKAGLVERGTTMETSNEFMRVLGKNFFCFLPVNVLDISGTEKDNDTNQKATWVQFWGDGKPVLIGTSDDTGKLKFTYEVEASTLTADVMITMRKLKSSKQLDELSVEDFEEEMETMVLTAKADDFIKSLGNPQKETFLPVPKAPEENSCRWDYALWSPEEKVICQGAVETWLGPIAALSSESMTPADI